MASSQLKKHLKPIIFAVLFLLFWLIFLFINLPVTVINSVLKNEQVQLQSLSGDFNSAIFDGIIIDQKYYPLSCHYERQSGLTYQVNCSDPLNIQATFSFSIFNSFYLEIKDAHIFGDVAKAKNWMQLANIPNGIAADIDFKINEVVIKNSMIERIDFSGLSQQVSFLTNPLIQNVTIKTIKKDSPIVIDIEASGDVELFLESRIENNQYVTKGTIKGRYLKNYASILNYFGKQTRDDEWFINLSGKLLP